MTSNSQEQKYKRWAAWSLIILSVITLVLGYSSSKLTFDYDFEKFFPQKDDDLDFFKEYRNIFENDNDFVLFAIENEEGIFKRDFLVELESLTRELETMPHVREVVSPINSNFPKLTPGSMVPKMEPYIHINQPELYAKDSVFFSNSKELITSMLSFESKSIAILLKHTQFINKKESEELATAIEATLAKREFTDIHYISKVHGQKEYIKVMKQEFLIFTSISCVVLFIFLWITYRSAWGIIVPLLTVILAVTWSSGIMQLSGRPLNMMTTLLPIIMLVVGMSDVVHLVSKYLEEVRRGKNKFVAIQLMLKKVGMATLLTSITTAIGFATLVTINMEPAKDFGIFIAIGVIVAYVVSIVFLPSVFVFMKKPKIIDASKVRNVWDKWLGISFLLVLKHRKKWFIFYSLVTLIALWGTTKIKFDYFLMHDLSKEVPLMQELAFFQENYGGIRPFELALIAKEGRRVDEYEFMREVDKIERFLVKEYRVTRMTSPITPYKFINKVNRNGKEQFYRFPEKEKRYNYLKKQLEKLADSSMLSLISEDGKMGRITGRIVDPGSRAMLQRNKRFDQFMNTEVDRSIVDYKLTGTPVVVDKSSRYLASNIITGLLFAFLVIAVMMGFLFRSLKMALLSLVPNIFPILVTAGFIGLIGVPLNMATALVFTIAFGIAVDDTIHFLSRYRQESQRGLSSIWAVRRTYLSTGRAIVVTTIILLGGFGSLIFSDFLSTYYIGLFVCLTLVCAVITDLTLLPLLLLKKSRTA